MDSIESTSLSIRNPQAHFGWNGAFAGQVREIDLAKENQPRYSSDPAESCGPATTSKDTARYCSTLLIVSTTLKFRLPTRTSTQNHFVDAERLVGHWVGGKSSRRPGRHISRLACESLMSRQRFQTIRPKAGSLTRVPSHGRCSRAQARTLPP